MWATSNKYYNSMKWHLTDPNSLEIYGEEIGWGSHKYVEERISIIIRCAAQIDDPKWDAKYARLNNAKIKEQIKLSQANICAYCKKARMKELGIYDMMI